MDRLTKHFLTFILVAAFGFTCFSQESNQEPYTRSFGLDASFINNFIPLENRIGFENTHLFHFFKYKEDNKFTRHGLDFDFRINLLDDGNNVERDDLFLNFEYKISKGKKRQVIKKGHILYGGEALFGASYRKNVTTNATNIGINTSLATQSYFFAVGPFVGFEYNLSKRISLYTEAGFYATSSYIIEEFKDEDGFREDFKETSLSISNFFNFPRSIILLYYF